MVRSAHRVDVTEDGGGRTARSKRLVRVTTFDERSSRFDEI
jgi:hypothetical protein